MFWWAMHKIPKTEVVEWKSIWYNICQAPYNPAQQEKKPQKKQGY